MKRSATVRSFNKLLMTAIAGYFLFVGVVNFVRFVSSTTDENLFRDSPSRVYVVENLPAILVAGADTSGLAGTDSVLVGDLITGINHRSVTDTIEFDSLSEASSLTIRVFRPAADRFYAYQVERSTLSDTSFTKIPVSVYVIAVEEGGVSDLAGMQVGDLIIRINRENFSDAFEADRILRDARSGTTISYDILRSNRRLSIPVTLASYGIDLSILILFLLGLAFWCAGAFLVLNRPDNMAARLIGFSFIAFGFVQMVLLAQRDTAFSSFGAVRILTLSACLPLAIALWSHSTWYFPKEQPSRTGRKRLTLALYILAALFTATAGLTAYGFIDGLTAAMTLAGTLMLMIIGHVLARVIYRERQSKNYLGMTRIINWTVVSSIVAALLLAYMLSFQFGIEEQFGFSLIPLMSIPLAYLYLIGRYQLLDMNFHVRRNIQYLVASTVWVAFLVVVGIKVLLFLPNLNLSMPNLRISGNSIVILDTPPDPELGSFLEKVLLMTLALGFAFLFSKVEKTGRRFLDRRFDRGGYDYNKATRELAEVMATKLGMERLAQGIVERLARLLRLKRIAILFFREEKSCCCQEAFGLDKSTWTRLDDEAIDLLVLEIQRFKGESRFSVELIPKEVRGTFMASGFKHIIPIRFKERFVGTFLIGEKLSEAPLDLEDLNFLSAIAKQASIAIENAFLYEELAQQERLKHELKLAREIQMASLPQSTPAVSGLDISGRSIPALEVGGDYFDYLNGVAEGVTVIVGDVSGKGTSAALYMSKVQGIIRSLHGFNLSPRELFIRANQLLCRDIEKKSFITAIGADIDTDGSRLVLARAGHLPLFYYNSRLNEVELITPKGLGLGLDKADIFADSLEEMVINYQPGDVFLFVTDGVTEAQTPTGDEFGEDKLEELLKQTNGLTAHGIRDRVISEVDSFVDGALPHDDQTVVVVKVRTS